MRRTGRSERVATGAERVDAVAEPDRGLGPIVTVGVLGLVVTKSLDLGTTVIGLGLSPTVGERNPVAAAAIARWGVIPGLIAVGVLTVALTAALVEAGIGLATGVADDDGGSSVRTGRAVCYLIGCTCNLAIAAHNVVIIVTVAVVQ